MTNPPIPAPGDALREWLRHAPAPDPLRAGMKYHVFLSYRSVNRPWVINLYDVLRSQGHAVFLDQVALTGGDALVRRLETGLDESQAGVLVWSAATADSEWVRREYEVMEARCDDGDFHFVPVRLDGTKLPTFARRRIFLDFSQYPDGPNGGELLRLLHAVVGKPLSDAAAHFASAQDEAAHQATAQIKAATDVGSAARLLRLAMDGGPAWETSSALRCAAAEGLTRLRDYEGALAVLSEAERRFPRAIRPKQLRALALARQAEQVRKAAAGDAATAARADALLEEAQAILAALYAAGERDPETVGIYGRTWMDRYVVSENALHLRRSRDLYAEAFQGARDDYYTGINAAAKSVLLGTPADVAQGRRLAQELLEAVGTAPVLGDYWKTATIGEAHLILGAFERAAEVYAAAVAGAPEERGSHDSTWQQACRLMAVLRPTEDERADVRRAFAHLPDCPA